MRTAHLTRRIAGACAAALLFGGATAGATDVPLRIGPAHPGDRATFAFNFTGRFSAQPEQYADTIVTQLRPDGSFVVNAPQFKPFSLTTTRGADGLLARASEESPLGDILVDYNAIVRLAQHRGAAAAGSTWQAQIPVRISPDTWHDLAVNVTVESGKGPGTSLVGQGHDETTLFYHGYTFPVDVTLHMNESFSPNGAFQTADFSVDEVTAGGSGPPISYTWHFNAQ